MAKMDIRTYKYLSDNDHFADVVNYMLYDGKQVINPQNLIEIDTTEIARPYKTNNPSKMVHRVRDILKTAIIKKDEKATYLIIGIENQTDVHYAMPIRSMLYDAERYANQVEEIAKEHRREYKERKQQNKSRYKYNNGEYLGGFCKSDTICPVITIVFFWSAEKWDGPMSLHEMLSEQDPNILRYVSDYKINLISPNSIPEDDLEKFCTDISGLLKYLKYSNDDERLQNILENDTVLQNIDRETAELINDITGSKLEFEEGKERINMCIATDNMRKKAADARSLEIAKKMLSVGNNTLEDVSYITDVPVEVLKGLQEAQTN